MPLCFAGLGPDRNATHGLYLEASFGGVGISVELAQGRRSKGLRIHADIERMQRMQMDAYECVRIHDERKLMHANAYEGVVWCSFGDCPARPVPAYAHSGKTDLVYRSSTWHQLRKCFKRTGEWAGHALLQKKHPGPLWEPMVPGSGAVAQQGRRIHIIRTYIYIAICCILQK